MASGSDERYLTTAEVARRLGVKTETVYAYASRGMVRSTRLPGRRGSFFLQDDIDEFMAHGRDGRQASGAVERIRTELTLLDEDRLFYRGHDVGDLAVTATFEAVAGLLWTGELDNSRAFPRCGKPVDTVRTALAALPPETGTIDAMRVAVAVLGAIDPLRLDLSAGAVVKVGELLISAMVDGLAGDDSDEPLVAQRLAPKLGGRTVDAGLLNTTLVLLADHDLAASTVAARVAASARAHPYAVVSAGLGAVDGRYHGVQSTLAYRFLHEAQDNPLRAIAERQRAGGLPGFGHRIYQERDPRAELLLGLLRGHRDAEQVMRTVDAVIGAADSFPNVDLALAALMHAYELRPDAGEAIFVLARAAGWLAHAIEEYREPGLRFRPLGVYTGDRPER